MRIPLEEVEFSKLSSVDIGRVFWWRAGLFRGISVEHTSDVRRLFECGLIDSLVEKGLLVRSSITDHELDGYGLVLEHEVIEVVTYPREWTFSMLRDAALLVLDVNETAIQYGYQTKDCHSYNVLFKHERPVYVDIGSFQRVEVADSVLFSFHEFMRSYYYPLQIWRTAGSYLGRCAVTTASSLLPAEAYLKYRWPVFRCFGDNVLAKVTRVWHAAMLIQFYDAGRLQARAPRWLAPALNLIRKHNPFSRSARIPNLRKKLNRLTQPREDTKWSGYQDAFKQQTSPADFSRFDYVVTKISEIGARSVLEIAGNQGALCRQLAKSKCVDRVICTDADSSALDKGYQLARQEKGKVTFAVLNPFDYESSWIETPTERRLGAEVVVALAVTHHLALSNNVPIDIVFDAFARFSDQYLLVEFMPLGLYNGVAASPLPDWYKEAWFSTAFERKYQLIERIQLEENRILYIGKKHLVTHQLTDRMRKSA